MKKNKLKEINRKFVLVGDGYCGKSTLIAAFYNRKFVDKYTPTIFDTFSVTTDIYKKHVNLEICDSAGQNEYSRVRPLSYPEVDAIILCFSVDSRESSQNLIELWLPEIRHFCANKVPIVLVGCKIDLRLDRSTANFNQHFILKQEHLTNMNKVNNLNKNQHNTISSLHYGLYKTLALYCCRHGRPCTCYHSRICATNCNAVKRKPNQLSNSSNCLLNTISSSKTSSLCKDSIIRCNRMLIKQQSSIRNSTNTEDSCSLESCSEDTEELHSNTLSNSSCSLNGHEDKISTGTYNNSIYRHNQTLLNTLIHQQIEPRHQCGNSLNSSENDESEVIDNQYEEDQTDNLQRNLLPINNLPVDHLESSIEQKAKSQPMLINNVKLNEPKLLKGYKSFSNSTDDQNRLKKVNLDLNQKSDLKDKKMFKNTSLKQKLSMLLGVNSSLNSIYSSKSEKKLSNLFYHRKLSTSSTSIPFSLIHNKTNVEEKNVTINSPYITTEEGLRLCHKIGAQAYVECSSKINVGVDEVFRTALKLSIKHPISMKFHQLDMCSLI